MGYIPYNSFEELVEKAFQFPLWDTSVYRKLIAVYTLNTFNSLYRIQNRMGGRARCG